MPHTERHLPPWMTASLLLLAFCGAVFPGVQRNGTAGWEALNVMQLLLLPAAIAATAGWIIWVAASRGVHNSIPREFHPWLAIALLGVAVKLIFPLHPALFFLLGSCFQKGALWSLFALAMLAVILRRDSTPSTGAASGALAGLAGFTVCEIFCPITEASHILMAHLSLGLVFAAAGMVVGPVVSRVLHSGGEGSIKPTEQ